MANGITKISSTSPAPKTLIIRDYWRIEEAVRQDGKTLFLLQGRRRTSESFWSGMVLRHAMLLRLSLSIDNALTIVAGFNADDLKSNVPAFPTTEILAICRGPEYAIEISETIDGNRCRSIDTTIYSLTDDLVPCLHFIGYELNGFADDLRVAIADNNSIESELLCSSSTLVSEGGQLIGHISDAA